MAGVREFFGLAVPLKAGIKTFSTSGEFVRKRLLGEFSRTERVPDDVGAGS